MLALTYTSGRSRKCVPRNCRALRRARARKSFSEMATPSELEYWMGGRSASRASTGYSTISGWATVRIRDGSGLIVACLVCRPVGRLGARVAPPLRIRAGGPAATDWYSGISRSQPGPTLGERSVAHVRAEHLHTRSPRTSAVVSPLTSEPNA